MTPRTSIIDVLLNGPRMSAQGRLQIVGRMTWNPREEHLLCAICEDTLDPACWLQVMPPCSHHVHYLCLRRSFCSELEAESTPQKYFSWRG